MNRAIAGATLLLSRAPAKNEGELRLKVLDDAAASFPAAALVLRTVVRGREDVTPMFGVMADWEVAADGDPAGFEASRVALFERRVDAIPGFFADLLFRHAGQPPRYTVLGLYRSRDDLDLARGHPAVQKWARANPVAPLGARDLYGAAQYSIEEWNDGWFPG